MIHVPNIFTDSMLNFWSRQLIFKEGQNEFNYKVPHWAKGFEIACARIWNGNVIFYDQPKLLGL